LAAQVAASVAAGARVVCGGRAPARRGFFYEPTALVDVAPDSPALAEELFGPVAAMMTFDTDAEALRRANATRYGLGASVWTADAERGRRLAVGLEVGSVFVNGLVQSDPRLPFGGVKDSGFGRELGREGLRAFAAAKTIWVR
ncbi:MAG TPA: aldehyde dehydrogenase family protein, partial [Candidatus Polarisedimenticolaceae bacterium]|nr:aldehyde dehydrogenase family protein [Candidatus Polarisedimenticolaceae bacterium]